MIAVEKKPSTAPVFIVRCPVHKQAVGLDGEGVLLGRCSGCCEEAAVAQRVIERSRLLP